MSEFLKFAFEFVSQIVYNLVEWIVGIVMGFLKLFVLGVPVYANIFYSYFSTIGIVGKLFAILLVLIVIAIPVLIVAIVIRHIIINVRLKAQADDNKTLYKEIGRLNKQVLELMDEKNMILGLKTGVNTQQAVQAYSADSAIESTAGGLTVVGGSAIAGIPAAGMAGGAAVQAAAVPAGGGMADPLAEGAGPESAAAMDMFMGGGFAGGAMGGGFNLNASANLGEDAISAAATAAAVASAHAKSKAEEEERSAANRFPKLHLVDLKYESYEEPEFDDSISLKDFVEGYRLFACSQMHLYYTPEIIRRFVAGMAASKILILEGISGTGKTSLPYSFSRYIDNPATLVSVQPSFRDRTELLGYFNEFSKKFNETEFLRALYEAGYRQEPSFIVLDEMNLARIEYYFAEMLSILEMPNKSEWVVDLVPTAWPGDPIHLDGGKITVSPNTWFVGTANNDDSTFTITDKVYDRAMPIELNERANAFECELQPRCNITTEHLEQMFEQAKADHPISEATLAKMIKLDQYLQTRFKLAFGNRIMKQMYDFIPVYVACGGTEIDGLDYIVARKVLKKFESMNVGFVRDEIKGLIEYIDKTFGESHMEDSRSYLLRIQNLY
ncbi:MAG: hypothetical protein MJ186_04030 [Clostridia bacterium]|nr:hypothetical protein [Clostridia bacterium]